MGISLVKRNSVLLRIIDNLKDRKEEVLSANASDLEEARQSGLDASIFKRLLLDEIKLEGLLTGLRDLVALPDPLGLVTLSRTLSPGLELERVSCPLGVLAIIFEARPEAVIQIASLALKSGNAVILKGGKEASRSNAVLVDVVRGALKAEGGFPVDAVQFVSTREDVAGLLVQDEYIDLVIPRGSMKLVRYVKAATRIPVLGHADGICHVYLDATVDGEAAAPVVVDSKTQYPAACNAAETLLVHPAAIASGALTTVAKALLEAGVTLHADPECFSVLTASCEGGGGGVRETDGRVVQAVQGDWDTEWLSLNIGVACVASTEAAVAWINSHGSHHTDCILTQDEDSAAYFLANVDSAGVYRNASTRFADGFRYGFGAEVGISTNRLHARGPVGLEGLTTYKYTLRGNGHTVAQFANGERMFTHEDHPAVPR